MDRTRYPGNKIGENEIEKIEGNCILNEHWKGSNGGTGSSYNYYDVKDSTWNPLWIDNSGNVLKLKGKLIKEGMMCLKSEPKKGKDNKFYSNQITWTLNQDQSVTQLWVVTNEQDSVTTTLFIGIYKKTA